MIFSPHARSRARCSVLALAVAGVAVLGCDPQQSTNNAVMKSLDEATAKAVAAEQVPVDASAEPTNLVIANEAAALEPARQAIATGISQTGADPALLAVANGTAADLDLQVARLHRGRLVAVEQKIRGELAALRAMATQIALSNYLVAGYAKQDPADRLAKIKALTTLINGGAEPAWTPPGTEAQITTVAAAGKEIEKLEAEAAARRAEIEQLTADRTAASNEAEEKTKAADAAKGTASVAIFKEAADARRRADELLIKAELVAEALGRAEADLQVAKGQQGALQTGVQSLETQSAAYQQGWKSLGERTAAQRKLASEIHREGKGQTIDALLTSVNDLSNQAAELRTTVNNELQKADKNYLAASNVSKKINEQISSLSGLNPEDLKNWNSLRAAVHPNSFLLQQGAVRREMGIVAGAEASVLSEIESTRALVKTALDAAGLPAPAEGVAVDKARLGEVIGGASENFDTSVSVLQSCESGDAPQDVKDSAMVSRLATYGAMLQLQAVRQAMGETDAATKSQQLMADATDLRNQIIEKKLAIPALPGELGAPPSPAPAPAATPAAPAGAPPIAPAGTPETPAAPAPAAE